MRKRTSLVCSVLCAAACAHAQQADTLSLQPAAYEGADFTFNESQLGEDDEMTQNIISVGSSNNIFTQNYGYRFGAMRYKYRGYNSRFSDVYFNGVQVNNAENGQFNYSTLGGMNDATRRHIETALPFEDNEFSMTNTGGASNYNFRASTYAAGHRITLSGTNRNYRLRGIYSFATGQLSNGWAFMGTVGYRWANEGYVEGTFYNSLGYFLTAEKRINDRHSLAFATWGNPTERAQQGASTDEAYWLANDPYYNPNWGYQDGEKRSSRVVNNFEPTAMVTWDFDISRRLRLSTSVIGRYAMYSSTKLNYNNANNPAPDYWKNFPSYNYNVWDESDAENRTDDCLAAWENSFATWTAGKANRQIQWDQLYFANRQMNAQGGDAAYFISAKHNDHLMVNLASTLKFQIDNNTRLTGGLQVGTNKGMHYQTMEDMLGADTYHNLNTYAVGTYLASSPEVQYDLNHPNALIREGDRYGYDYNLFVDNIRLWAQYVKDYGISHTFITANIGGTQMWRDGRMRNGLAADHSYGKSGKARFLDGGAKLGTSLNLGYGNALTFGVGMEARAPKANTAFQAPEIHNDFVSNLHCEKVFTTELGYALNLSWLRANLNAYYTHTSQGTEWQNFYYDDVNSFTYVSLQGVEKDYYGVELGLRFKVTSDFNIVFLGSMSEAKYTKDTDVQYMHSTSAEMHSDICYNKDMREGGTPLTAASLGLDYRIKGWWLNLSGNYYDRIYLGYSPNQRYLNTLVTGGSLDNSGNPIVPDQAKGKGGFMVDASIGRQFYVKHNVLGVNLMLCNILNNTRIVTGGYEQSRSNYSVNSTTTETGTAYEMGSVRTYKFDKNPKKFYAQGFNFMLNINYRF